MEENFQLHQIRATSVFIKPESAGGIQETIKQNQEGGYGVIQEKAIKNTNEGSIISGWIWNTN